MVFCYECRYYRHEVGVRKGIPFEFFLCDAREQDIKKRFLDKDIPCKLFRARDPDECSGDCEHCEDLPVCSKV